jgi:hypothetical protein
LIAEKSLAITTVASPIASSAGQLTCFPAFTRARLRHRPAGALPCGVEMAFPLNNLALLLLLPPRGE